VISFEHQLPSMNIDGRHNGTYNNAELVIPGVLTTLDPRLGQFMHCLQNTVREDRRIVFIDGRVLVCSNNWIRDHVHEMKGFKHWEYDLRSFLQFILDTQRDDGCYFELIKQLDDEHWKYVDESSRIIFAQDNVALVRLELEADIEYLAVEGALQVYRATGDFGWLCSVLPKLEKGIDYITSDPKRWDAQHGLVKRPFTIDTWDFTSKPNAGTDRRIHEGEPMSIMHGDNSGVYAAMNMLAWIRGKMDDTEKAQSWRSRAEKLRENMMRFLWNGKHFVHQLHLNHAGMDDREGERLSLSNAYDINRGVTTARESRSIIDEYIRRREKTHAFAEWFSIDPPYEPAFGCYKPGHYVNGAISPFAAGELALAAFENGREDYGWSIISRFMDYVERDKTIYFLYSPENMEPQGRGPSAWGAASLLNAVDEGLAGIVDLDARYRVICFSPRFPVTDYRELRYLTGYEVSHTFVDLRFILKEEGMRYDLYSPAEEIRAHILLPKGKDCTRLLVNGEESSFTVQAADSSRYVDFAVKGSPCVSMEILF